MAGAIFGRGISLTPITAKRPIVKDPGVAAQRVLLGWGTNTAGRMFRYPPVKPWKHGFPKSGPRKGGRRTRKLGNSWSVIPVLGGDLEVKVANPVAYAGHVQGLKQGPKGTVQTSVMKKRGWKNVADVGNEEWKKKQPELQRAIGGKV